jgi:hypothetical protein
MTSTAQYVQLNNKHSSASASSSVVTSSPSSSSLSLSLRIYPGYGLGAFLLGLPLNKVLRLLRVNGNIFPHVDIRYQLNNPLLSDITVDLTNVGVRLRFDAHSQRLRFIEIYPQILQAYNQNNQQQKQDKSNEYDFFTHSLELLYLNHVCSK